MVTGGEGGRRVSWGDGVGRVSWGLRSVVGWVDSPDHHHHLGSPEHVLSILVAPQDQE